MDQLISIRLQQLAQNETGEVRSLTLRAIGAMVTKDYGMTAELLKIVSAAHDGQRQLNLAKKAAKALAELEKLQGHPPHGGATQKALTKVIRTLPCRHVKLSRSCAPSEVGTISTSVPSATPASAVSACTQSTDDGDLNELKAFLGFLTNCLMAVNGPSPQAKESPTSKTEQASAVAKLVEQISAFSPEKSAEISPPPTPVAAPPVAATCTDVKAADSTIIPSLRLLENAVKK